MSFCRYRPEVIAHFYQLLGLQQKSLVWLEAQHRLYFLK